MYTVAWCNSWGLNHRNCTKSFQFFTRNKDKNFCFIITHTHALGLGLVYLQLSLTKSCSNVNYFWLGLCNKMYRYDENACYMAKTQKHYVLYVVFSYNNGFVEVSHHSWNTCYKQEWLVSQLFLHSLRNFVSIRKKCCENIVTLKLLNSLCANC